VSAQEPWGGSLKTYEIVRSCDFLETPPEPPPPLPALPEPDWSLELATPLYIASLPNSERQPPGWRSMAWRGPWLTRHGGLNPREAAWWWRVWTHERLPTQLRHAVGDHTHDTLRHLDALPAPTLQELQAAWRDLQRRAAQTASRPNAPWWLGLLWAPRLWLPLLPARDVLATLTDHTPAAWRRHLYAALSYRDATTEDEDALHAAALTHLESMTLSDDDARYDAIRLVEAVWSPQAAACLYEKLIDAPAGISPAVTREAMRLLRDPERVAEALDALPYPISAESVAELIALGGWEALRRWTERAAEEPALLEPALPMLLQVHAPEIVPAMLALTRQSATARAAYTWLIEEGANAVLGLFSALASPNTQIKSAALRFLHEYDSRGHASLIERIGQQHVHEELRSIWSAQIPADAATKP
jgi:hypothetical protein